MANKLSLPMKTALLGATVRHGGNNLLIKTGTPPETVVALIDLGLVQANPHRLHYLTMEGVCVREELIKNAAL